MDFKVALHQAQEITNEQVRQYFQIYHQRVADIPDPWADRVISWLETYSLRSGKALRPLLVATGVALSQHISVEAALQSSVVQQLMMAVELNHKRILMADDVADQDELRHGGPAMHVFIAEELCQMPQYAELSQSELEHIARSYTEVAGIWMQEMVSEVLMSLDVTSEQRQQINDIFRRHTYDMTATGWYSSLDQNFWSIEKAEEDIFLEALRLVTGEYTFVSPLLLGAVLGSKFSELAEPLRQYGRHAGVLYQISDDILGLFGDPEETGKPVGNDIREGKKTLLVQYAYANSAEKEKKTLAQLLGKSALGEHEVEWVQNLVQQSGAEEKTRQKADEYLHAAITALESLPVGEQRTLLQSIAEFILSRTK